VPWQAGGFGKVDLGGGGKTISMYLARLKNGYYLYGHGFVFDVTAV